MRRSSAVVQASSPPIRRSSRFDTDVSVKKLLATLPEADQDDNRPKRGSNVSGRDEATTAERSRRARDTAERLRDAAREVFAELGYVGARVEDVVRRAGVSHGTFYTYYPNKAAILEALVRGTATRLEAIAAAPWEASDVTAAIERVIGAFLEVYADEVDVIGVWFEAAATEPGFAKLLRDVRHGYVARVAENLAPIAEVGGHDPRVAASALVGMVEGYATERYEVASAAERTAAVRTLTALWYGGLQQLMAHKGAG